MDAKEELKRILIKYCYWYYVKAEPMITDFEYDRLFRELQRMEGDEIIPDSPTQMIYGDRRKTYKGKYEE